MLLLDLLPTNSIPLTGRLLSLSGTQSGPQVWAKLSNCPEIFPAIGIRIYCQCGEGVVSAKSQPFSLSLAGVSCLPRRRWNLTILNSPAMSPDINFIENVWKVVKNRLQKTCSDTLYELWTSIEKKFHWLSDDCIRNFSTQCRDTWRLF